MKRVLIFAVITAILLFAVSCKNASKKNVPQSDLSVPANLERLIVIGKNIITEVIVKPDTAGDPWEVEKVRGFDGKEMFTDLLEKLYKRNLIAYDCFTDEVLDQTTVKRMQKEVGRDISKIGKIQFLEDWYFDPLTSSISKKIKSVTFGYEIIREGGLPTGYKCLFRLKTD